MRARHKRKPRLEVAVTLMPWNFGLGIGFQVGHGHYPWSVTVDLGPWLIGAWLHKKGNEPW